MSSSDERLCSTVSVPLQASTVSTASRMNWTGYFPTRYWYRYCTSRNTKISQSTIKTQLWFIRRYLIQAFNSQFYSYLGIKISFHFLYHKAFFCNKKKIHIFLVYRISLFRGREGGKGGGTSYNWWCEFLTESALMYVVQRRVPQSAQLRFKLETYRYPGPVPAPGYRTGTLWQAGVLAFYVRRAGILYLQLTRGTVTDNGKTIPYLL
jgi:hypothetical protein